VGFFDVMTRHFFFFRFLITPLAMRTAKPSLPVFFKTALATLLHCRFFFGVFAFLLCFFALFAVHGMAPSYHFEFSVGDDSWFACLSFHHTIDALHEEYCMVFTHVNSTTR